MLHDWVKPEEGIAAVRAIAFGSALLEQWVFAGLPPHTPLGPTHAPLLKPAGGDQ